jgi:uncharacterized protein (TIGR03437 family)
VQVPADAATGTALELVISVNRQRSNPGLVAIR